MTDKLSFDTFKDEIFDRFEEMFFVDVNGEKEFISFEDRLNSDVSYEDLIVDLAEQTDWSVSRTSELYSSELSYDVMHKVEDLVRETCEELSDLYFDFPWKQIVKHDIKTIDGYEMFLYKVWNQQFLKLVESSKKQVEDKTSKIIEPDLDILDGYFEFEQPYEALTQVNNDGQAVWDNLDELSFKLFANTEMSKNERVKQTILLLAQRINNED